MAHVSVGWPLIVNPLGSQLHEMLSYAAALGGVGEKKEPHVVGTPAPQHPLCHSLASCFLQAQNL